MTAAAAEERVTEADPLNGPFMSAVQLTDYSDEPGYAITATGTRTALDTLPPETGTRAAVIIAHARGVLDRAVTECKAWHGDPVKLCDLTSAAAELKRALRTWGEARSEEDKNAAVLLCAWWDMRVVATAEDAMGWDAAEDISSGEEGEPE